jgi:hypothetical protein
MRFTAKHGVKHGCKNIGFQGRERAAARQQCLRKSLPDSTGQTHGIFRHGQHHINSHDPGPGVGYLFEDVIAVFKRSVNDEGAQSVTPQNSGQLGDSKGMKKHGFGRMGIKIRVYQQDIGLHGLLLVIVIRVQWFLG